MSLPFPQGSAADDFIPQEEDSQEENVQVTEKIGETEAEGETWI